MKDYLVIVAALAILATGALGGVTFTAAIKNAEIADIQKAHDAAVAKAERQARERLQAAQARGDRLTTELETANRAAAQLQENLDAALRRATTGRACLNQPALRLLDGAHGLTVAAPVPPPAGGADAADGAAAAHPDERVSTDTDIALWIGGAGRQYEECRRRLDALIDWYGPASAP